MDPQPATAMDAAPPSEVAGLHSVLSTIETAVHTMGAELEGHSTSAYNIGETQTQLRQQLGQLKADSARLIRKARAARILARSSAAVAKEAVEQNKKTALAAVQAAKVERSAEVAAATAAASAEAAQEAASALAAVNAAKACASAREAQAQATAKAAAQESATAAHVAAAAAEGAVKLTLRHMNQFASIVEDASMNVQAMAGVVGSLTDVMRAKRDQERFERVAAANVAAAAGACLEDSAGQSSASGDHGGDAA